MTEINILEMTSEEIQLYIKRQREAREAAAQEQYLKRELKKAQAETRKNAPKGDAYIASLLEGEDDDSDK